jgi:hypothetical protein
LPAFLVWTLAGLEHLPDCTCLTHHEHVVCCLQAPALVCWSNILPLLVTRDELLQLIHLQRLCAIGGLRAGRSLLDHILVAVTDCWGHTRITGIREVVDAPGTSG